MACAAKLTAAQDCGLEVEILLYSGRPNPVLLIEAPDEVREIVTAARALPAPSTTSRDDALLRSRLGYRGLRVTNRSREAPEIQSFNLRRHEVELQTRQPGRDDTQKEFREDRGARIEQRLLQLAQSRGVITPEQLDCIVTKP